LKDTKDTEAILTHILVDLKEIPSTVKAGDFEFYLSLYSDKSGRIITEEFQFGPNDLRIKTIFTDLHPSETSDLYLLFNR